MTKDSDIHPVLIIVCIVMLGITAAAMEKFSFSPALDTTKLEAEDLLHRRTAGALRPGIEVK